MKTLLGKKTIIIFFVVFSFFAVTACDTAKKESPSSDLVTLEKAGTAEFEALKEKYSDKVILFNFFASWCPPCKSEIPGFIDVYNKHKDKFVIIGLSVDESMQDAVDFVDEMNIPYPTYHASKDLQRRLNISSLPTNIFYAPGGRLFNFYIGALNEDFLEKVINQIAK